MIKNKSNSTAIALFKINITENCNLRCKYCHLVKKNVSFNERLVSDLIIFLKKLERPIVLSFIGGEPLLEFNLIRNIIKETKKRNIEVQSFDLTTNGSLLTKEITDFLGQNNCEIKLSLDGIEKYHNLNRYQKDLSESYRKIVDFIPYLIEKDYRFGISAVVHLNTAEHLAENASFLYNSIKNPAPMSIVPSNGFKWDSARIEVLKKEIKKIIEQNREDYENIKKVFFKNPNEVKDKFFYIHTNGDVYRNNYSFNIGQKDLGNIKTISKQKIMESIKLQPPYDSAEEKHFKHVLASINEVFETYEAELIKNQKEIAVSEKKKWVSLTGLCNNNCIFCLDGDRTDRFHRSEKEIKREIDKGVTEGATRLVLSGGEPTIHPNIIDFVKYGKQKGYRKIQIITNGRMLAYRSFVNSLKEAGLDEVTFSLHGYRKEVHEAMTRIPGSFNQIVKGIRNAINAGFIVNSDTTITKLNYKFLKETIEFVHSLGINEVNLMSIVPFGNAWKNRDKVIYEFEEVMPYVNSAIEFCKLNNIFLWFSRYPAEYLEGYEDYIESYKKILEDVIARGEDFFKQKLSCSGERCKYCGIKTVCNNLFSGSYTKFTPPCMIFPKIKIDKQTILKRNKSFRDFAKEICENSRIKGISCKKCIFDDSCEGVLSEDVRKKGFGIITLVIKQEIRINLDCNQNCLFCNTDINAENFLLNESKIIDRIKNWVEEGVNYLVITGKEPTLHNKLEDFIRIARDCGYKKIELQTNAIRFSDKRFAEKIKEAGLTHAFISFHSSNKKVYEKITQSKTFDDAIGGVRNLFKNGINVTFNIVINALNYKELLDILKYLKDNFPNAEGIVFSFVAPVSNALNNRWVIPKIKDTILYLEKALDFCKEKNINCRIPSRCGIPVCFMPKYKDFFDEITEKARWRDSSDKVKIEKCHSCEFNDSCNGLWNEYFKIHGFN